MTGRQQKTDTDMSSPLLNESVVGLSLLSLHIIFHGYNYSEAGVECVLFLFRSHPASQALSAANHPSLTLSLVFKGKGKPQALFVGSLSRTLDIRRQRLVAFIESKLLLSHVLLILVIDIQHKTANDNFTFFLNL